MNVLWVALGGALGAVCRYGLTLLTPWSTLTANLLGCLLAGLVVAAIGFESKPSTYYFLVTGVLGGFTTFSAFGLECEAFIRQRQPWSAVGYAVGSVLGGLLLVGVGIALGSLIRSRFSA